MCTIQSNNFHLAAVRQILRQSTIIYPTAAVDHFFLRVHFRNGVLCAQGAIIQIHGRRQRALIASGIFQIWLTPIDARVPATTALSDPARPAHIVSTLLLMRAASSRLRHSLHQTAPSIDVHQACLGKLLLHGGRDLLLDLELLNLQVLQLNNFLQLLNLNIFLDIILSLGIKKELKMLDTLPEQGQLRVSLVEHWRARQRVAVGRMGRQRSCLQLLRRL